MRAIAAALMLAAAPVGAVAFAQTLDYAAIIVDDVALERSAQYVSASGAALHGYDPVAYHTAGQPTPGDASISLQYNGATWLFSSTQNRDLFAADPAAYAPAFDGHCAFAASKGAKAQGHPLYWHIEEGVLYVNVNADAQAGFTADVDTALDAAVTNWNEGTGGVFRGGPLYERDASRPLRNVAGEVDPA